MTKISMIQCDRCGKMYSENTTDKVMRNKRIPMCDPNTSKEMDFCSECTISFDKAIRSAIEKWFNNGTNPLTPDPKEKVEEPKPKKEQVDMSMDSCYTAHSKAKAFRSCTQCEQYKSCKAAADPNAQKVVNKIKPSVTEQILKKPSATVKVVKKDKKDPVMTKDHRHSQYKWTKSDLDYLYAHKNDSYDDIANHLGRSKGSVSGQMSLLGLTKFRKPSKAKNGKPGPKPAVIEQWQYDYIVQNHSLMTKKQLAEAVGFSVSYTYKLINQLKAEGKITEK